MNFDLLDKRDFSRVRYRRVNERTGREVPWNEIVKGYQYKKGEYVALSDNDFARANVEAWSADGRLAYLLSSNGTTLVVGSSQVSLPFAQVTSLAWSIDGTRFVVTARKNGAPALDLYTVKTDGSDPVRLTTNYDASGAS